MIFVWLWDACGPDFCGLGVTDEPETAKRIVEEYLQSGTATSAQIEAALIDLSIRTLADGYNRTGSGWRGFPCDSGVRWERFIYHELPVS